DELKFDSELRQKSNFDQAIHVIVDKTLHYGICVAKKIWNSDLDQLEYVPVDASKIIVPAKSASLKDVEFLAHCVTMSEFQYRRNPKFIQDEELIKKIKGSGQPGTDDQRQQEVDFREGVTGSKSRDSIVLWEVYYREAADSKTWKIATVS